MSENLVIVESPAKSKTIEKYLGSDYRVISPLVIFVIYPQNMVSMLIIIII